MNNLKLLAVVIIVLVIANLILFSFRLINSLVFWMIIIIAAINAYYLIPKIKKKQEMK